MFAKTYHATHPDMMEDVSNDDLRARYLVDVDCFSEVRGQPIRPRTIRRAISEKLARVSGKVATP